MTVTAAPRLQIPGIPAAHQPVDAAAPGWPVVLYFHHVHPELRHYTSVTPREFAAGLELLLERFDPYDPAGLLGPDGPARPERPSVLLTFDDGYRDNFVHARPLLESFGVKAVFFVATGLLGRRSDHPRENYLDWEQCDELAADGHLIAAHTRTHPHLDGVEPPDALREVHGSLADITARYGAGAGSLFAYPYGGIPDFPVLPERTLAFGTVRSGARPWTEAPHAVRRTYLPSGQSDTWPELVHGWRQAW